jgi:predicted SAM-dependent methyltransferase
MSQIKEEQTKKILKQFLFELAWAGFVISRRLKIRTLGLKRLFIRPQLPQNSDGKVLIHLGCGDVNSPEFINVDARPAPHVHYVRDVTDLSIFPDNHADIVYASHLLEHIRHNALRKTLWEWRRVLKPGGILRLSVPDFDALLDIYEACGHDIDSIAAPLMGGQDYAENIHYSVFNQEYLARLLKEAGFQSVRKWDPQQVDYHAFEDWASKTIEYAGKKYRVSLNLEAIK